MFFTKLEGLFIVLSIPVIVYGHAILGLYIFTHPRGIFDLHVHPFVDVNTIY